MSTLTFLRKFSARFALGLAVLAMPNAVLATTETSDDSTDTTTSDSQESEHPGRGRHHEGGGDGNIHITLTPGTIDELSSLLSQFDSFSCQGTTAASTLLPQ